MGAALCALHEVARDAPEQYKNLVPSFVSILKQVAEHRLPKSYDYHKTPAPFIQVRLLKILALLGVGDRAASEHMYTVLADVMRRGNTGHTIGNAVVYECVRTITAIHPNATLLQVKPRPFLSPALH
jgi:AP-4 complex subunit epsilon-1